MNYTLKFKMGTSVLEVATDTFTELLAKGSFLGEAMAKCEGRKNLIFFDRPTRSGRYSGIRDVDTGEELTFHQHKPPQGGFYLTREDTFKKWEKAPAGDGVDQGDPGETDDQGEPGDEEDGPAQPKAAYPARQPSQGLGKPPQPQRSNNW